MTAADAHERGSFVVLGASGGIGSEVYRVLHAAGADVLAAARPSDRLQALEAVATPYELDPTSFEAVEQCLRAAAERAGGKLVGVAHCVGSVLLEPAHSTSEAEWGEVLTTNLTSAFAAVRAAGKTMRGGGSVVLCSSAAARTGFANHEAIAAAKAGVEGIVRSAAAS